MVWFRRRGRKRLRRGRLADWPLRLLWWLRCPRYSDGCKGMRDQARDSGAAVDLSFLRLVERTAFAIA
jgi:hypothetical protein